MIDTDGIYARASAKLREKMYLLKGQWFEKRDACEVCGVDGRPQHQEYRDAVGRVLYNWTHELKKEPIFEQRGKRYRLINRDFKTVKPGDFSSKEIEFVWPYGIDDHTSFQFDKSISIQKGDVIGLGGEGNKGKSLFGLNVVTGNMDIHPTTLVLSENVHRLEERLSHFDWVDIYKDGDWKFEVLEAHGAAEFLDIARERCNNLIVFDWLSVTQEAYRVAEFYEELGKMLDEGVALVIQQKRSYKDYPVGGEGALDYTSAFLLLQSGRISVEKAKVTKDFDPTGKMYSFKIIERGSRFHDISEVKNCHQCKGKKYYQGDICGDCNGTGYKVVGQYFTDEEVGYTEDIEL